MFNIKCSYIYFSQYYSRLLTLILSFKVFKKQLLMFRELKFNLFLISFFTTSLFIILFSHTIYCAEYTSFNPKVSIDKNILFEDMVKQYGGIQNNQYKPRESKNPTPPTFKENYFNPNQAINKEKLITQSEDPEITESSLSYEQFQSIQEQKTLESPSNDSFLSAYNEQYTPQRGVNSNQLSTTLIRDFDSKIKPTQSSFESVANQIQENTYSKNIEQAERIQNAVSFDSFNGVNESNIKTNIPVTKAEPNPEGNWYLRGKQQTSIILEQQERENKIENTLQSIDESLIISAGSMY